MESKSLTGFVPQPNAWQCGPFALKHGLLALGILADERVLTRLSGATEEGADERDLGRAAAHYRCALGCDRFHEAGRARAQLMARVAAGTPVLLCVDQWSHWITAVSADDAGVVILDSRLPGVFHLMGWDALLLRLAYRKGRGHVLYDLHPIVSSDAGGVPARLSRSRVEFLMSPAQRDLGRDWALYLELLLPLHRRRSAQVEWTVPLGESLREHAANLLVARPTRPLLRAHRRVTHAAFVADAHGLRMALDGTAAVGAAVRQLREVAAA